MIEYSWQVVDLPVGEEPPRFQLLSYVVFSNDLNAINGNRKNYNSPIMFHKLGMPNGLIDSLNRVHLFSLMIQPLSNLIPQECMTAQAMLF